MSSVALKLVLSIMKLVPGGPTAIRVASWARSFLARFFGRNKQLGHKGSVLSLNNPDPVSKALEIEIINRCGGICMLRLPAAFEIPRLTVPACLAATSEYLIENGLNASGLFRIPGQTKTVNAVYRHFMTQLDDGRNGPFQVEMTIANPALPTDIPFSIHDITSVYKKFLAGVDGGILGSLTLFNALKEVIEPSGVCVENILDASSILTASRIAEIIMETESRDRYFLITAVFGLLAYIKEHEGEVEDFEGRRKKGSVNHPEKMSSKALGVVFAPLLLGNKTDEIEIESFGKDAEFQQLTKLAANSNKAKANQVTELAYGMARNDLAAAITEGLLLQWSNIACFLQGKYQDSAENGFYPTQLYIPKKRASNSISKSRDVSENWPFMMMPLEDKNSSMKRSITTNPIEIGNRYRPNKGDRTTSLLIFPRECRTRAEYDLMYPPSDTDWEEPSDYSEICRKAKRYMEQMENGESIDFEVEVDDLGQPLQDVPVAEMKDEAEKKPTGGYGKVEAEEKPVKPEEEEEEEEEEEADEKVDGGDEDTGHVEESREIENLAANAVEEIRLPEEPAPKPVRRSSRSSFSRIPRRSVDGLRSRGSTMSSSTSSKYSLKSIPEETEPFPPLYEEPQAELSSNTAEPTTPWRIYRNNNYESQLSLTSADSVDDSILESGSGHKGRRSSSSRIPRFRHMLTGSNMSSEPNTPSPYARRGRIGLTTATPSRLNQVHSHADELLHHVSDLQSESSLRANNVLPSIENKTRISSSRKHDMPRGGRASSVASELSIRTEDFDAIETNERPEMANEETAPPPPAPTPTPTPSAANGQNSKMSALYAELHRTQRELTRQKQRNSKLEQDLEEMRMAKGSAFFIKRLKEAENQMKQWRERAERAEISCLRRDHEQAGVIQEFVEKRLEARKS